MLSWILGYNTSNRSAPFDTGTLQTSSHGWSACRWGLCWACRHCSYARGWRSLYGRWDARGRAAPGLPSSLCPAHTGRWRPSRAPGRCPEPTPSTQLTVLISIHLLTYLYSYLTRTIIREACNQYDHHLKITTLQASHHDFFVFTVYSGSPLCFFPLEPLFFLHVLVFFVTSCSH